MNTGSILAGRPRMGAWVTYGLGSANQNLPTFVVMQDDKEILGGVQNYSSGFLPATYQGTLFRKGDTPILNLKPPAGMTDAQQRNKLEFLQAINDRFGRDKQDDTELDARTRSYELAYQMQSSAPEAVDLSSESEATKKLYGMDDPATSVYGTNCLLARRLVERGVRFVEVLQRLGLALGCARQPGSESHRELQIVRQAGGRSARGSESSRHVEGHAGGVGRGIRPHAVRARQPERRKGRARSQSVGLHHVDGGRRREGRPSHRHHRRDRPARGGRAAPRSRYSRVHSLPAGSSNTRTENRRRTEQCIAEYDDTPDGFGRIAATTARQVILQRLRDAEDELTFGEYAGREGDIVAGVIQQGKDPRAVLVDLGKIEAILPPAEQVPGERYAHGERLRCYVLHVRKVTARPRGPCSYHPTWSKSCSRWRPRRPPPGAVDIVALAREAGHRTKIAVISSQPGVNAKGACIGPMGSRVRNVMTELHGEKIDIVDYSEDPPQFVAHALSPARVLRVNVVDAQARVAQVIVPDYQLSLAIGKEGQNARLAARLTGWKIDIQPDRPADPAVGAAASMRPCCPGRARRRLPGAGGRHRGARPGGGRRAAGARTRPRAGGTGNGARWRRRAGEVSLHRQWLDGPCDWCVPRLRFAPA